MPGLYSWRSEKDMQCTEAAKAVEVMLAHFSRHACSVVSDRFHQEHALQIVQQLVQVLQVWCAYVRQAEHQLLCLYL